MDEKRKASKFIVNKNEYMAIRVDLRNPLSALWLLEQARDLVKSNIYRMQQLHQEQEKKLKVEIANQNTKNFIANK